MIRVPGIMCRRVLTSRDRQGAGSADRSPAVAARQVVNSREPYERVPEVSSPGRGRDRASLVVWQPVVPRWERIAYTSNECSCCVLSDQKLCNRFGSTTGTEAQCGRRDKRV